MSNLNINTMTPIAVVELTDGYEQNIGWNGVTGIRSFVTATARPDAPTVMLPTDVMSFNSLSADNNLLVNIQKVAWDNDPTVGYRYICTYSENLPTWNPLADDYKVLSITTDGAFDSYTFPKTASTSADIIYAGPNGSGYELVEEPLTIHNAYVITRVQLTTRFRGSFASIISDNALYNNKLNNATWNGIPRGCVLCTGITATSRKEVKNASRALYWDRTISFSIKTLPYSTVSDEDSWQMVLVKGVYCRLAHNEDGSSKINQYEYASLPESLT